MRKRVVWVSCAAIVIVVLLVVLGSTWDPFLFRAMRGVSTIEIVNDSGRRLTNVRLVASGGRRGDVAKTFASIENGDAVRVAVKTADLYLRLVTFEMAGRTVRYEEPGISTTGEIYSLRIDATGVVQASYHEH